MKGNKNNITKFVSEYVSIHEDGVEYINSATVKKLLGEIPKKYENVVAYTESDSKTGAKMFCVKTFSARQAVYSVRILD